MVFPNNLLGESVSYFLKNVYSACIYNPSKSAKHRVHDKAVHVRHLFFYEILSLAQLFDQLFFLVSASAKFFEPPYAPQSRCNIRITRFVPWRRTEF